MANRDPELQALLDKQAITEQLLRYCRSVDRLDRQLLESVYWPDATENHGNYRGAVAGFIDYAFGRLQKLRTQHRISNVFVELQGDTQARCETYVHAHHEAPTMFGFEHFVVGARYLDLFEKRGAEWRIKRRTLVIDYCSRAASTDDWGSGYFKQAQVRGEKSPGDPLYKVFL
jgi:hypothetical protein